MEPIKQIVEAAHSELAKKSEKSDNATLKKTGLPKHWVSAIFEKFDVRYPHKWTAGIEGREKVAIEEWSCVLDGLNGNDIKRGFETWKGDWPPSAIEFLKACRGGYGLPYTPEMYQRRNRPQRDRSKLLSSDAREEQRQLFKKNIHALAESLREGQKEETKKKEQKINYDIRDYAFMVMLLITKEHYPNIAERIEAQRPGSFNNV